MADIAINLVPSAFPMGGGEADVTGTGQKWNVTWSGALPAAGSKFTLVMTDGVTAVQNQVGAGDATGITPTFCFTYNNKVYILAGTDVLFSAVGEPTVWNDPLAVGNGYVSMANQTKIPEELVAIATYQGRLAFFANQNVQLWQIDSDPDNWVLQQVLLNIGTIAKLSVQSMGDLDVVFLADTGFRSLKVRDLNLNAFVDDIGSPVDSLIQTSIGDDPRGQATSASAVVEPTSGRYWCHVKDTIYVLSYYPSSKVLAWSTYEPKDSAGASFTPSKFVVFKGQVYCRGGNVIYQYGGSDRVTYDSTVATIELPWLDLKTPGAMKSAIGMNAMFTGAWTFDIGMDPVSGTLETGVWSGANYTYDKGVVPVSGVGSHFKSKIYTTGATAAVFSSLVFHYQENEQV